MASGKAIEDDLTSSRISRLFKEWFPSISAVTGDWYPARNLFQIIIAVTSGPRFLLILTNHLVHSPSSSPLLSYSTLTLGIIRTLCCAGWVYITSTDNHDLHDVFMIGYLVAGFGYMVALCWMSVGRRGWGMRVGCVVGFLTIVPFLVGFYWRHKVERVPGGKYVVRERVREWSTLERLPKARKHRRKLIPIHFISILNLRPLRMVPHYYRRRL